MTSKIEGISAETVDKAATAVATSERGPMHIAMERDFSLVRIALTALLASGEVVLRKDKTYYAWLIEQRDENGKPTWLCNPYYPEFTDNAWDALHFGRKSDAEAYGDSELHTLYITEHSFPALARFNTKPSDAGYASVHGGCAVLHRKCPKCGDNILHNSTGFECGGMHCDYSEGGEPYRAEKFTTKPKEGM